MADDVLLRVNKPGRYIGNEWNVAKKDFDRSCVKFALCFPDLYEVGMSNLGVRIIYGILNSLPDSSCERFFACGLDLEDILRNNKQEILSLESKRSLKNFDIAGFSLGYELSYTNVLNMLQLSGIPFESASRDSSYPLIIGGGPCTANPEPMHEFFDLFVLGEAEEVILEIVALYKGFKDKFKTGKMSKEDLLLEFSRIEGVYVPSLYDVKYNDKGEILEFTPRLKGAPSKIRKRFIKDLDSAYFPLSWVVPYIQIVHDRIALEIMRGCPNRCRFCQARSQYFPFRQRSISNVLDLSRRLYKQTGYEEISLCGLSVSDYSHIDRLLEELVIFFKDKAVGLSLPSIKPQAFLGQLSSLIATIKKTGLTFAPEAGSERLRNILGKDFDTEDFSGALRQAYAAGYQHVKLYFMIGLPSEDPTDLDAIINFATQVSNLKREAAGGPALVNISINTLIPKPQTPFQWLGMPCADEIKYKQDYLKKNTRNRRLRIDFHQRSMSALEGILSRGDRRLSRVILSAFNNGAKFDAWQDHFDFTKWMKAFSECGIDPEFYLKEKSRDSILPWDFIDIGISKESMLAEFDKTCCNKTR